jgi:hypothetical protein
MGDPQVLQKQRTPPPESYIVSAPSAVIVTCCRVAIAQVAGDVPANFVQWEQ